MVFICRGGDGVVVWSWLSLKVQPGLAVCTFSEAPVSCAALVALYTETQKNIQPSKLQSSCLFTNTIYTEHQLCMCFSPLIILRFVFVNETTDDEHTAFRVFTKADKLHSPSQCAGRVVVLLD